MTIEDKNLLLKDLCGRLPYGVRVKQGGWEHILESADMHTCSFDSSCAVPIPYLHPLSSMTEEEKNEYEAVVFKHEFHNGDEDYILYRDDFEYLCDWLNAHHFDYRGLIEKGIALEAPEGMYEIR